MKHSTRALCAIAPLLGIGLVAFTNDVKASEAGRLHALSRASMPMHRPGSAAPMGCSVNMTYFGGPIISNVQIVQVNWSSRVDPSVQSAMPGFYKAVTASSYFDWLGEYDTSGATTVDGMAGSNQKLGHGSFLKSVTITPANTATSLTDDDIQKELAAQITSGALPAPSFDSSGEANTIYMIDFPLDDANQNKFNITDSQGAQSCVKFCAYHGAITVNGKHVAYGVHPDMGPKSACSTGCGSAANYVDDVTSVHSHELIEAVTDRDVSFGTAVGRPLAWYADGSGQECGEIGDICNAQQATIAGYTVQKLWSNKQNACVAEVAGLAICDGVTRPCRACTAADNGVGCTGATPVCETDAANAKTGQCVACTSGTQCTVATKPVCDKSSDATTDDTCRGCKADNECPSGKPRCTTATGACVQCSTNADCSGATPICDSASSTCRACTSNADCTSGVCATGAADGSKGKCVQCTDNAQCTAPQVCDTSTDSCGAPKPVADAGGGGGSDDAGSTGDEAGSGGNGGSTGSGSSSGSSGGCNAGGSGRSSGGAGIALLLAISLVSRKRASR